MFMFMLSMFMHRTNDATDCFKLTYLGMPCEFVFRKLLANSLQPAAFIHSDYAAHLYCTCAA